LENKKNVKNVFCIYAANRYTAFSSFTLLFCTETENNCAFRAGAPVDATSPYIGREAWFIATLIGAIGSLVWLALCILGIFIYRRCRRCGRFNKPTDLPGFPASVRFYSQALFVSCLTIGPIRESFELDVIGCDVGLIKTILRNQDQDHGP